MPTPLTDETLVQRPRIVLPSLSFAAEELAKITGFRFYEERFFPLAVEATSTTGAVFLTSTPMAEDIVDYYCSVVPDPAGARRRVTVISPDDASTRTLSEKIIDRADVITAIRDAAGTDAYLYPFNVTDVEARVADALDVPIFGAAPELAHLGSKSGSRRVARDAGVAVPDGAEDLRSLAAVEEAIHALDPRADVVIKFNDGFSGMGNAIIQRADLRSPVDASATQFGADDEDWTSFERKIGAQGAIVEELVRHDQLASPSVQMRILPSGTPEVLSSHDQVLGDPRNQVYLGCRFPADDRYREQITTAAVAVGRALAREGVRGPFGIDFIVVPERVYLSEINLRMGGTTHPFVTACLLTTGTYDAANGALATDRGPRWYVASDNIKSTSLVGTHPMSAVEAIDRAGLAFDRSSKTGTTLHLLGALEAYGKVGIVCVGASRAEAQDIYERTVRTLTA